MFKAFGQNGLSVVLLALVATTVAPAGEFAGRHYMVVFGYQGHGNRAVDSHTFASFWNGDDLDLGVSSVPITISWLPASGIVRPLRRERGKNFSLRETLGIARQRGYQVATFGPYEISVELYRRANDRNRQLKSGTLEYKMINGPFSGNAINCINAVGDIVGDLNTGTQWGFAASSSVVLHLSRFIYGYPAVSNSVSQKLRLQEIIRGQ